MYMFSVHYASLSNLVHYTRKVDLNTDEVILETIADSLVVLHGTDPYWLELDEHGYIHVYAQCSNVRNNWVQWGCLPHEELLVTAMREVDILIKSPLFKTVPAPLTGKTHALELRDEQGVLCEWSKRSWVNPSHTLLPTLRCSCLFMYSGADTRLAEASVLQHLPENSHASLFAVETVLWFDAHAPWIDTRLLTPRVLRRTPILRISRENFMEMDDLSDVIESKRHVTRARKNDALFVPRSSLHWRGVVSPDGTNSYSISYNWRVILLSCPIAYATGKLSPDTLITVLPEEHTLAREPTVEQLAHVLDTSWKIPFPKMHLELHMFEDSAPWPLAEYGLMRVDGVLSKSAYVRHTHKVGILLHHSLVDEAFEGFALQNARHLKKALSERDMCCICTTARVNCIVECGHLFCHSCITQAYEESTACPTCRRHYVEWTCLSTTIRIPCAKTYQARIAAITKRSSQFVLLSPCADSQKVLHTWFPAMTVCHMADFQIPPYKTRLLITWTPTKDQLNNVHKVIQEFAGEGKRVEIITSETVLDISKGYPGMSESSTYYN